MPPAARTTSEFSWINVLSPQAVRAREFFAKLLGWSYAELPGMGHTILAGESEIGTFLDLGDAGTPRGTPPHIGVVLKVENAEAVCHRVDSLGGKSSPLFDLMDLGPMAVCVDPNGAEFDVWEPRKIAGAPADPSAHGVPSWFELTTGDASRAATFYSGLFGWRSGPISAAGLKYTAFKREQTSIAGLLQLATKSNPLRPQWSVHFTVDDIQDAARDAVALGARVHEPVQEIPGLGTTCGITSPQGLAFSLIRHARG